MIYPDKLVSLQEDFKLYMPDEKSIKPVYEELLGKDPATLFPFLAKNLAICDRPIGFSAGRTGFPGRERVLEIGTGIGLPSFLMAAYAAEMALVIIQRKR